MSGRCAPLIPNHASGDAVTLHDSSEENAMNRPERKRRSYETPDISVCYVMNNDIDFLTASGEDPDQGEWDPQPDYFIVGNKPE